MPMIPIYIEYVKENGDRVESLVEIDSVETGALTDFFREWKEAIKIDPTAIISFNVKDY